MFASGIPHRVIGLTALSVAGLLGLTACGTSDNATTGPGRTGQDGGTIAVIASFYPMAWLTRQVGGPDVSVATLTKPGAEPHDLELTTRQIADIRDARFTVYVRGEQPVVDRAVAKNAKDKSLNAASVVKTLPVPSGAEEAHEGEEAHDHEALLPYDPHVWLDPSRMATIATALGNRLAATDSAHAAEYRDRAKSVAAELNALDQTYREGLKTCKRDTFVTGHAAFQYMANRYGLKQVPIAGIDPGNEPSPGRLAELTKEIKATGATTVFTETLVSPKVAETLARETGLRTAVLDPVEGVREGTGDDYLSIMKKNLETLRPALACS